MLSWRSFAPFRRSRIGSTIGFGQALRSSCICTAWPGSRFLLAVVGALYRQFSGRHGTARLALLLFAIDDAHAPVVSWIARSQPDHRACARVAGADRAPAPSRQWFRAGIWLGPLLFGLGLLASESALIAGAYLVSFAAVLDSGSRWQRYGSLVPYAALVLVWRVAYGFLGYGAANSGLYVDPVRAPLAFIGALFERLPVLSLSQLALPWAELWEIYPLTAPWLRYAVGALAWMTLLGFGALLRPLWRENRSVRFFGVGALLALVPVCASFPHDRLLLGAGVGAMGVMAEVLRRAFQTSERAASRLTRRCFRRVTPVARAAAPPLPRRPRQSLQQPFRRSRQDDCQHPRSPERPSYSSILRSILLPPIFRFTDRLGGSRAPATYFG